MKTYNIKLTDRKTGKYLDTISVFVDDKGNMEEGMNYNGTIRPELIKDTCTDCPEKDRVVFNGSFSADTLEELYKKAEELNK